ncbi:hypothetical protein KIPB_014159 [Kipferlia bialata]|uniref:Uncharacterized protein n=1 Tax=Kipferlia bialata TaxID=797122 RepID=A0A9K3GPD6_9EUKA|nr:hypothetical protein KIPB_014159 [Kipferlia bialata]|eukprot:g14159.t1
MRLIEQERAEVEAEVERLTLEGMWQCQESDAIMTAADCAERDRRLSLAREAYQLGMESRRRGGRRGRRERLWRGWRPETIYVRETASGLTRPTETTVK